MVLNKCFTLIGITREALVVLEALPSRWWLDEDCDVSHGMATDWGQDEFSLSNLIAVDRQGTCDDGACNPLHRPRNPCL